MTYLNDGKKWHLIDGCLVEDDALRIAQAIKDYDPDLELICLDPTDPKVKITTAPFMVVARHHDGSYYKVLEAWELDERILHRIWSCDKNYNNVLASLETMEERQRRNAQERYREYVEGKKELMVSVLKNPKTSYTYHNDKGDLVQINDRGPMKINKDKKSFNIEVPNVGIRD